jgi:hypothetical protein
MANNYPAIRPSLSLDMVNGIYVDSRVTFTRAGTRTYYGQEMVKAEENLFTYSEQFENAAWVGVIGTKPGVTANAAAAPDGTMTADALIFNAQFKAIGQANLSAGLQYTYSIWLKVDTGTRDISLVRSDGVTLATFTVTSAWQRFVHTFTSTNEQMGLQDANASGFVDVLAWGAQLEQRSAVTAYTATTTQPITNYQRQLKTAAANEWPREFDPVTGECLGRSVWEARTNLFLRSEEFDNASWTKADATILANQIIAPDGTLTADKIVSDLAGAVPRVQVQPTLADNTTHTATCFFKAAEWSWVNIVFRNKAVSDDPGAWFNLATGEVGTVDSGITASISPAGNGFYRCSVSRSSATGATTLTIRFRATNADNTLTAGDGYSGIYIWGAQLEAGAFATPYIPTVAAQVTRLADSAVMTGVNFSSWFNPSEGSFFSEALYNGIGNYVLFAKPANYPTDNTFIRTLANGNFAIVVSGVAQANMTPTAPTTNTFAKVAGTYKTNDFAVSLNGATPVTDTSGITPNTLASLEIGSSDNILRINSYIKRITYYNQALTAANLQAITR